MLEVAQIMGEQSQIIKRAVGKVMFSKMRERFAYMFLRPESELYDPSHPDWIFKYLRD